MGGRVLGLTTYKKINVPDVNIMRIQDNIESAIAPVLRNVILNSVLLKDIELTASVANEISHKLAQNLTGWVLIRNRANAVVWDEQDTNKNAKRTLILQTSANTVVDLLVF